MKIKQNIYLLLLSFSLVPVCIFGSFSIYKNSQKIEEVTKENLKAVSTSQIMSIQSFCEARKEAMRMIASYELVQDAVMHSLGRKEEWVGREYTDNLLREFKECNSFIASLSILNKEFHVVASSERYVLDEESHLKYVNEKFHTGDFTIGDVYERETDDGVKRVVPAYVGIFSGEELVGYIAEEIDTVYFDELRAVTNISEDETYYILDGNGILITAGSSEETESRKELVSSEEDRKDFNRAWHEVERENSSSGEISYLYRGAEYITYYSDIDYTDWGVRITANLSAQLKDATAYRFLIILVITCLTLCMIVAEYFVTRQFLYPMEQIEKTLKQVKEKQDYSLRIEVKSKNEMGFLAEGINELLDYIEEEDIQEKAEQRKLKQIAECDPLTGVKNKKAIEQQILNLVQQNSDSGKQIVIGFLDIDDFRNYNTKFGHQTGDKAIQFVAEMMKETIVDGVIGRNGGDEFIFCYTEKKQRESVEQEMKQLLKRLNDGFHQEESDEKMPVPCSIGIVMSEEKDLNYTTLVQRADEAMYRAKEKGKNTFSIV